MLAILFFVLLSAFGFGLAYKNYKKIARNIQLGKAEGPLDRHSIRLKNLLLIAFGQKKMFKLWKPAILHLFIYVAFILTQIELLEILIDGLLNRHRVFAASLGGFYTVLISFVEILSVLALIATVIFLWRRNVLKLPRFNKPEMKKWPTRDANIILVGEILLVMAILTMNGAEQALKIKDAAYHTDAGHFLVSSILGPSLLGGLSIDTLHVLERAGWWLHYIAVLGFINYLPYSKHLHILLAFPTTYGAKLQPRGEMTNMPIVMQEVKSMLGISSEASPTTSTDLPEFGVKDVFDLPRRVILSAYSCTECGRCTAVCPANITGKKLSPRKIMMDIRDRSEEIGKNLDKGIQTKATYEDGKTLFSYISAEEIHACTTCQACIEACPILIDPMEPILELRRNEILSQSKGPANWTAMFNSLENSGCVWPMSESRAAWTQ